jgi:phosphatidate cytidylyltransferase
VIKRIISAIIVLAIIIPIIYTGGLLYDIFVAFAAILGLREFMAVRETKKIIPDFIKALAYILLVFMILFTSSEATTFSIDYRLIAGIFMGLLIPTILYHDQERYSVLDAFYLISGVFFIGISFIQFILLRSMGMEVIIYLLLISICTDTFAYATGMLIGKHKLIEVISPNKSIEGMIGGTFVASYIASLFYVLAINPDVNTTTILLVTIFLSVVGQLGDLLFSAIKRYYGKKDFSNLIPGHGGLLDRVDSLIFIVLAFTFFIALL